MFQDVFQLNIVFDKDIEMDLSKLGLYWLILWNEGFCRARRETCKLLILCEYHLVTSELRTAELSEKSLPQTLKMSKALSDVFTGSPYPCD